jgi:demethylmenaquinone methyltransferase/2-methoxy-6-polyprenyl-1,4-benzoquinol methylase
MFDRIAPRYDLCNRLLSFGTDVCWRRRMLRLLPPRESLDVLDLATGTADQVISIVRGDARVVRATGLDMSENMLAIGREKLTRTGLAGKINLRTGDAGDIPEADKSADLVTISFGIRNVTDVPASLREMLRVLRPGGRVLILEFSLPENRVFRPLYLFYLRHILPPLGHAISGDSSAYRYLNQTIETFPCGEKFCLLMRDAGFTNVLHHPLSFGIATIYQGDKNA